MISADDLRLAVVGVVFMVAAFDLGLAFIIRAVRESTPDGSDRD